MTKSPLHCEHANENPCICNCPPDCYCQENTCKDREPIPPSLHSDYLASEITRLRLSLRKPKQIEPEKLDGFDQEDLDQAKAIFAVSHLVGGISTEIMAGALKCARLKERARWKK